MARNTFSLTTSAARQAPAGVAKTILQLASAADSLVAVTTAAVTFRGVSGGAVPVRCLLLRQTGAGTGGSPRTPVKRKAIATALRTTGQEGPASGGWTTEPTDGDLLDVLDIHPQSGVLYPFTLPDDEVHVENGGRLAIKVLAAADVDCNAMLKGEE